MLRGKFDRFVFGVLGLFILAGPAAAQLIDIGKFKGIMIPYNLEFGGKTLEKGQYDLETLKNPTTPSCYLRFKKKGKVVCLVEGERLELEARAFSRLIDPSVSQKPQLKMKKDTKEKVLVFLVQTGRDSLYPYLLLQFKLKYQE